MTNRWPRSVVAVVSGFLITAIASTAVDAIMHAAGVFPSSPRMMTESLFVLASGYRALFTVLGGFVAARLAPDKPMRHAWVLAWIGLAAGFAGIVYYYLSQEQLGPVWYPIAIAVESIPCVWFGGRVAISRRARL